MSDITNAIRREREYQEEKWGWLEGRSVQGWLLILESELNEAKEAWVKTGLDEPALREILQVVAVGIACLEEHGVVERLEIQSLKDQIQNYEELLTDGKGGLVADR